jgi:hypothetical protein
MNLAMQVALDIAWKLAAAVGGAFFSSKELKPSSAQRDGPAL